MIDDNKRNAEIMEAKKNNLQNSQSDLNNLLKDLNFHDPSDVEKLSTYEAFLECSRKLKESEERLAQAKASLPETQATSSPVEKENSLKDELSELYRKKAEASEWKTRVYRRERTLAELEADRAQLGSRTSASMSNLLKESQDLLQEKTGLMSLVKKYLERKTLAESYEDKNEALTKLSKEAQKLSTFLERSRQVEIEALEITVALLNVEIKRYLDIMFPEEPISVEFKTIRESKTKADAKTMTCSMSIFYRNAVYASHSQLSGGEADRVSLSMMLALGSLLGSNIIMLDETLNTLDRNAKIQIVELLKQVVGDTKMCFVVSHEGVEGVYDGTMLLGNQ
jgi:DNA repair exonuclease SbcCD ATPase subunit